MQKYLYLSKYSFSYAWLEGGTVPIKLSSTYKSAERHGIFTPDENLIDDSSHDIREFSMLARIEGGGEIHFDEKCLINGKHYDGGMHFVQKVEDGLVLCMANSRSNIIAKGLKKAACVKILDVESLKLILDEQIGVKGEMGKCTYTNTHKRGHFLKSHLDAWQDEFRIFWPVKVNMEVTIPPKIAQRVSIKDWSR